MTDTRVRHRDQKNYRARCEAIEEQYVAVVNALHHAHDVLRRGDAATTIPYLRDYLAEVIDAAEAFRGTRGLKE